MLRHHFFKSPNQNQIYQGVCGDNLTYTIENNILEINGTGRMYDSSSDSKSLWIQYSNIIHTIIITEGCTYLGKYCFSFLSKVKQINLPQSLTSAGEGFCYECTGLEYINIPPKINFLPNYSFNNCINLSTLIIEDSKTSLRIGYKDYSGYNSVYRPLFYDISLKIFHLGRNLSITYQTDNYSLWTSSNLNQLTIGNNVTTIPYRCAYSGNITNLIIPDSITTIEDEAFNGCTDLNDITFSKNIQQIGSNAFHSTGWYNNQPDGLCYIGKVAYCYKGTCPNSFECSILEGTISISDGCFKKQSELVQIYIPDSTLYIGCSAFYECTKLSQILGMSGVISIDGLALNNTALQSINLTENLTYLGNEVFCFSKINYIKFPNSIVQINKFFNYCQDLIAVSFGINVSQIQFSTFEGCTSLEKIICNSINVPTLSASYNATSIQVPVYVPAESLTLYQNNSSWKKYFVNILPIEIFTFTISSADYSNWESYQCQAIEGMTWQEWIDSEYNTYGFYVEHNKYIRTTNSEYYDMPRTVRDPNVGNVWVLSTDIIAHTNYEYTLEGSTEDFG